jgi:hypothetical protein
MGFLITDLTYYVATVAALMRAGCKTRVGIFVTNSFANA